jgi:ribosomal protein L9
MKNRRPKTVWAGSTPVTPVTAKRRKKTQRHIKKRQERQRKIYPEIHGKVVDFITHTVTDGTLYVSVRFKDKTNFSIRYACNMFVVGMDLSNMKAGNLDMIREYMKPIPR